MRLKYVIFDNLSFLLAPETVTHREMSLIYQDCEVKSAGFIDIETNNICCYGRSESLGIDSDPENDADHIRMWSNLGGGK